MAQVEAKEVAAAGRRERVDLFAVGSALKRAQHEFRLALNASLGELDTNISQLNVLRGIDANPGISSAQLARLAFLTPQTLGQQLIEMQRRGLIERRPADGRRLEHYVTQAGKRLQAEAMKRARAVHARVLVDFDEDELESLAGSFRLIARRASEERARAKGVPSRPLR